jgi:hypothetical protein
MKIAGKLPAIFVKEDNAVLPFMMGKILHRYQQKLETRIVNQPDDERYDIFITVIRKVIIKIKNPNYVKK